MTLNPTAFPAMPQQGLSWGGQSALQCGPPSTSKGVYLQATTRGPARSFSFCYMLLPSYFYFPVWPSKHLLWRGDPPSTFKGPPSKDIFCESLPFIQLLINCHPIPLVSAQIEPLPLCYYQDSPFIIQLSIGIIGFCHWNGSGDEKVVMITLCS